MTESKTKTVIRFCIKEFLYVMEKNNGRHHDPYEAVVKSLQKEYGIDRDSAYDTVRRPYWYLMDTKVLNYKGVEWAHNGRQVDVGDAVNIILNSDGEDITDIIADWHKI